MFPKGTEGFLAGFQIAVFAFVGVELIGTTAAETKDPKKNLPKAINAIPIRIILFYVLALLVVMSVTPWNMISANKSPFVELFLHAGIPTSAIIMNLVVLSSVTSSMNSGVFSTSRMLFGLSRGGRHRKHWRGYPNALFQLMVWCFPVCLLWRVRHYSILYPIPLKPLP